MKIYIGKNKSLLLPFAETKLAGFSWADEVWEEPVVKRFLVVPLALLVIPVGGQTSEVTSVELKTSLDVLGQKLWVAVVFWVFVTLHPQEQSKCGSAKTEVQENHTGEELPSIGWLLVSVVSVFEVTVVKSVNFFGAHQTPVSVSLGSNGVQFWILIGEFWCLWERNQKRFVVIVVSVGMFEKFFVLLDRHHVSRVVDKVLFHSGGGHTSEGQSAAD